MIPLPVRQQHKSGLGRLIFKVSRSHTHTQKVGLLWTSNRLSHRPLHTQQTKETNIHAFSGNPTRDNINPAVADLHLRPNGHQDPPCLYYLKPHYPTETRRIFFELKIITKKQIKLDKMWVAFYCTSLPVYKLTVEKEIFTYKVNYMT